MIPNSEQDYLMLSGIQHMAFCKRQWALIHVEQLWAENVRTIEGQHLHERVDNPEYNETRKGVRIVRGMPLVSKRLGLTGVADVVEFISVVEGAGVKIKGRRGLWRPVPIEYKRGKAKKGDCDAVQLCAQAMALEEMLGTKIEVGQLFYAQTKRRVDVPVTPALRLRVMELAMEMHEYMGSGTTPKAEYTKACEACSLIDLCNPRLSECYQSVSTYYRIHMQEGD